MNDWPNLRDHEGVVHLALTEPSQELRATRCEFDEEAGFVVPLYSSEELWTTRAPVTCFACLAKERLDASGSSGSSSH